MGSEQSSQQADQDVSSRVRSQAYGQKDSAVGEVQSGSISPRQGSICSEADIPYISYTVNRPIGDSPKLQHKHLYRGQTPSPRRSPRPRQPKNVTGHNIVVVKEGMDEETTDQDPERLRLQSIPTFLPIMRGALSIPAVRDTDVLDRLDHSSLLRLCLRYQEHLRQAAETVTSEQNQIGQRIREIDFAISTLMTMMTERQKAYAKHAEKLGKVQEVSHMLNRCHMMLNETLESMETLNNMLPIEERLEPFVWTTG